MIKMKYSSIVINILVLFLYSCVYGQDTLGKNDNPAEEVHFKKLNEVQGKYLHWIDKKNREFPFAVPAIAYNKYDGIQIGAAFINLKQPVKHVDFTGTLFYGIKSKKVSGTANLDYYYKPKKSVVSTFKPGIRFQSFTYYDFEKPLKYHALHPEVELTLNHRTEKLEKLEHKLAFRAHIIFKKDLTYEILGDEDFILKDTLTNYYVNVLSYTFSRKDKNFPLTASINIEQSSNFVKSSIETNAFIRYQLKDYNTGVHFRMFMGAFLWRKIKKPNAGYSLPGFNYNLTGTTGENNYKYDELYFGRNENEGFIANQITRNDGFFKTVAPLQSPAIGETGNFLFALNTTIDFPIKYIPLKLFFDIGFTRDNIIQPNTPPALKQFAYDGGFMFSFFNEGFEIYFPLFYSKEFKTYYKSNAPKFGQRISFLLDLHKLELHKKIRDMKFQ